MKQFIFLLLDFAFVTLQIKSHMALHKECQQKVIMRLTKIILFLFTILSLNAFANDAEKKMPPCATKEACLNDPNCHCWCSQSCSWRKKTAEDHPVYIEDDPYGKYCYCKQWDFDHYKDNCIERKNVKQPKGAK